MRVSKSINSWLGKRRQFRYYAYHVWICVQQ